ncbi:MULTISPECIES: FUSC family protein [Myxococcaceae]|uniref:FUSC family protein n=1 Tax=Myxococcaceae TaxID=31 RepID=UPI001E29A610|nr:MULTISPECIES: FUSC family protein [Myxococcaceae]
MRAALATVLPLVVASLLRLPAASWVGLAGYMVTLADKGGSYRTRAQTQGALAVLAALAVGLAALAGGNAALSALLVLACVVAGSFARCYGEAAAGVGRLVGVLMIISLATPVDTLQAAGTRAGFVLLGGAWAMLLALGLWPLYPYRPARRAVAEVYRVLAFTAEDLARRVAVDAGPSSWSAHAALRHARLRPTIEAARTTLAATRLGRSGETGRGEHLMVLLEGADLTGTVLIALAEAMESAEGKPAYVHARAEVHRLTEAYGRMARWVVRALEREQDEVEPRVPRRASETLVRRAEVEEQAAFSGVRRHPSGPVPGYVAALLDTLRSYASVAYETAAGLLSGRPPSESGRHAAAGAPRVGRKSLLAPLSDHLGLDSPILRHALRVGLMTSFAVLLTHALGLDHGYWVTVTVLVVLQPYAASTEERALQRVVGTMVGACVAALVATFLHAPLPLLVTIFLLSGTAVALMPLNYGLYQMTLTPAFVLLAEMSLPGHHLAGQRILNTLLGGGLALLGTWVLWPSPERRRFPDFAAALLRADAQYLREVAASAGAADARVRESRRRMGRALLEAEASFQRLAAEYHGPPAALEPAMALLTYARRFAAAVTTLSVERGASSAEVLEPIAGAAGQALEGLAQSLSEGRPPGPLRPLAVPAAARGDAFYATLLERVPRQLGVLHGAVARLTREVPLQRRKLDGDSARSASGWSLRSPS